MSGFFNLPLLAFIKNGIQTAVSKDTVTPANSTPLPVEITSANGDVAINAANLNLEVQTTGFGPYPDSMQITDGVDTLAINADGSTNVVGHLEASGQSIAGRVTDVTINNLTWTALPATPLANRNALVIQNRSGQLIKLNYSSGVSGFTGVAVDHHGERSYDMGASIILYAKSETSSCIVTVEEIS